MYKPKTFFEKENFFVEIPEILPYKQYVFEIMFFY